MLAMNLSSAISSLSAELPNDFLAFLPELILCGDRVDAGLRLLRA